MLKVGAAEFRPWRPVAFELWRLVGVVSRGRGCGELITAPKEPLLFAGSPNAAIILVGIWHSSAAGRRATSTGCRVSSTNWRRARSMSSLHSAILRRWLANRRRQTSSRSISTTRLSASGHSLHIGSSITGHGARDSTSAPLPGAIMRSAVEAAGPGKLGNENVALRRWLEP
jgi:hypothetical protein